MYKRGNPISFRIGHLNMFWVNDILPFSELKLMRYNLILNKLVFFLLEKHRNWLCIFYRLQLGDQPTSNLFLFFYLQKYLNTKKKIYKIGLRLKKIKKQNFNISFKPLALSMYDRTAFSLNYIFFWSVYIRFYFLKKIQTFAAVISRFKKTSLKKVHLAFFYKFFFIRKKISNIFKSYIFEQKTINGAVVGSKSVFRLFFKKANNGRKIRKQKRRRYGRFSTSRSGISRQKIKLYSRLRLLAFYYINGLKKLNFNFFNLFFFFKIYLRYSNFLLTTTFSRWGLLNFFLYSSILDSCWSSIVVCTLGTVGLKDRARIFLFFNSSYLLKYLHTQKLNLFLFFLKIRLFFLYKVKGFSSVFLKKNKFLLVFFLKKSVQGVSNWFSLMKRKYILFFLYYKFYKFYCWQALFLQKNLVRKNYFFTAKHKNSLVAHKASLSAYTAFKRSYFASFGTKTFLFFYFFIFFKNMSQLTLVSGGDTGIETWQLKLPDRGTNFFSFNGYKKKYLLSPIIGYRGWLKLKLIQLHFSILIGFILNRPFRIQLFNCFNLIPLTLKVFCRNFAIFFSINNNIKNRKEQLMWLNLINILFICIYFKNISAIARFLTNELVLRRRKRQLKFIAFLKKLFFLSTTRFSLIFKNFLLGICLIIAGKIGRRPRAKSIKILASFSPSLQPKQIQIFYTCKRAVTFFGVISVKFWFYCL